jgi:hypothetical protein
VSTYKKIRQDPASLPSLLPVSAPCSAGKEMCLAVQRLHSYCGAFQKAVTIPLAFKVYAQLSVDQIADNQGSIGGRVVKRSYGRIVEFLVGCQDLKQYILVNACGSSASDIFDEFVNGRIAQRGKTLSTVPLPLSKIHLAGCLLKNDRAADDPKLDIRLRRQPKLLVDILWNRDLPPISYFHTSKYEMIFRPHQV